MKNLVEKITYNNSDVPAWASIVANWYQLDKLSYVFCEFIQRNSEIKSFPKPSVVLLALPQGSNEADFNFASDQHPNPYKFIYTLPNVSFVNIANMLKFDCSMYCLNKGKHTLTFCLETAEILKKSQEVWVFSAELLRADHYQVCLHWF